MSDDLVKRLRKVEPDAPGERTRWHRNPDGPEAADRIEALEKALIEMRNTVYLHPVRIGDSEAEMNAFALTTRALLEISKKMKVILADASVKAID